MNENYIVPILIAGSILIPMFMFYFTVFIIISKNRQRKNEAEKKELEFQYEKQLLQTTLEVQEKGLNQLSQEIHDNIGQRLTGVLANLITINSSSELPRQHLIGDAREQVSMALKDLRNVSHVLNSKYVNKIGLEESVSKEIEYLNSYNDINFDLQIDEDHNKNNRELSPEKELMIFRIAQEALSNIIKHADATEVALILQYEENIFTLKIKDNGRGLPEDKKPDSGIGLITMKQRAEVMRGILEISSNKDTGTTITLKVPYE